jgi:pimeloyl-ACP methyl ester carboxylesterase
LLKEERIMSGVRKAGRVVLITLAALVGCLAVIAVAGLVLSPGKPLPIVDKAGKQVAGSISEKIRVNINGAEEGMFIKGRDPANPVLLFVHGGSGMPEYFLTQRYPTDLEDYFTVCWWDRRGAGLSYSPDIKAETMTVERQVSDTLAVTSYLRSRFHQDKIYLMAHSGGAFFALQAAARAPELYHAYIGVAQITWQLKSENLAWQYMVKRFREIGDTGMADKLERAPITMSVPLPMSYMKLRDPAMHPLGIGTTRDMRSVISGVFLRSWLNREYTLGEKLNIWRGKFFSDRIFWNTILATDLAREVPELRLPVYFFHGAHDYTVSYPLAKAYFDALKAPLKGFYTFQESAHSPMFEEPAKMKKIFREDILAGTNQLADAR